MFEAGKDTAVGGRGTVVVDTDIAVEGTDIVGTAVEGAVEEEPLDYHLGAQ